MRYIKDIFFYVFLFGLIAIPGAGLLLLKNDADRTVNSSKLKNQEAGTQQSKETSPDPDEISVLINNERAKLALTPLKRNAALDVSAQEKCTDMITRNYWSHNAPDGTEPWQFFEKQKIKYSKAGENLGSDFDTSEYVVNGWMNSPTHKANVIDKDYTDAGYAVCHSDNYINDGPKYVVVQHLLLPR